MNVENVRKLIEGVRYADKFDMGDHETCLCGVGYGIAHHGEPANKHAWPREWWASKELWAWLEMPEDEPARQAMCLPNALGVHYSDVTKAQAIDMLEWFASTGEVKWRAP